MTSGPNDHHHFSPSLLLYSVSFPSCKQHQYISFTITFKYQWGRGPFFCASVRFWVCEHIVCTSDLLTNDIPRPIYLCLSKIIQINGAKVQRLSYECALLYPAMSLLSLDDTEMLLMWECSLMQVCASPLPLTWCLFEQQIPFAVGQMSDFICFCMLWRRVTERERECAHTQEHNLFHRRYLYVVGGQTQKNFPSFIGYMI